MTVLLVAVTAMALQTAPPKSAATFDKLAKEAAAARESNRLADAEKLYAQALRLRPSWKEGLWALGAIYYEQDRYREGRELLSRFVALEPQSGAGLGLLGLCEFHTQDYDKAAGHLERALIAGFGPNRQMEQVVRYHTVVVMNKQGRHEAAWPWLMALARESGESPELIQAAGMLGLRLDMLPGEVPPDQRDLVFSAGRAMLYVAVRKPREAREAFDEVLRNYGTRPNVHFMYGAFLLVDSPEDGVKAMLKELEISGEHVPALTFLSLEYLRRREPETALPYAERAAKAAPGSFATRTVLGRALVDAGQTERGLKELEAAVKLAPDSPQVRFALAGAYRKLGRRQDAEREQAEFLRLKKIFETGRPGDKEQ